MEGGAKKDPPETLISAQKTDRSVDQNTHRGNPTGPTERTIPNDKTSETGQVVGNKDTDQASEGNQSNTEIEKQSGVPATSHNSAQTSEAMVLSSHQDAPKPAPEKKSKDHFSNEGNDQVTVDDPPKQSLVASAEEPPAVGGSVALAPKLSSTPGGTVGASAAAAATTAASAPQKPAIPHMKAPTVQITGATAVNPAGMQPPPAATAVAKTATKPAAAAQVSTKPAAAVTAAVDSALPSRPAATVAADPPPSAKSATDSTISVPKAAAAVAATVPTKASSTKPATLYDERMPAASYQQSTQQAANEIAIAAARTPLTNMYGEFLCQSTDRTLQDARDRLKKAITQTLTLRQQFTDRVFTKYRVCLKPPPKLDDLLDNIQKDPAAEFRRLNEEITTIREEKEIEKREANKLNHEMAQTAVADRAAVLSNIDNAEQLMFLTAGLNLVILPEDTADPKQPQKYPERSRNISQAAATSGEVILDRTRKAAAMRVERQRRRQLQLLRGEVLADGEAESNYSRLQVLSSAAASARMSGSGTSRKTSAKAAPAAVRRQPSGTAKGGRVRTQSSASTNALFNLAATADEVKIGIKPCAATMALIARGVGAGAAKTTQQRLLHPHPESLGGRRRAGAARNASNPPEPFLQANLANTLPPLPATKERLERKPLPVKVAAVSDQARTSIQAVLKNFVADEEGKSLRPVSKIGLLNSLRKLNIEFAGESKRSAEASSVTLPPPNGPRPSDNPVDPALTMSVLHALGLIDRENKSNSLTEFALPNYNKDNTALCSAKFKKLRAQIDSGEKSLVESMFRPQTKETLLGGPTASRKRVRNVGGAARDAPSKIARASDEAAEAVSAVAVESIRGGGDPVLVDSKDASADKSEGKSEPVSAPKEDTDDAAAPSSSTAARSAEVPKKRKRSESSPTIRSSTEAQQVPPGQFAAMQGGQMPFLGAPMGQNGPGGTAQYHGHSTMNALQLANQLRMHHPSAGDLAEYLGSLQQQQQQQQQGYDLSALMSGAAAQSQLSALGFGQPNPGLVGYSLQDRAAAARAMVLREQQSAALLGGYSNAGGAAFPHAFYGAQGGATGYLGPQMQQQAAAAAGGQPTVPSQQPQTNRSGARTESKDEKKPEAQPKASKTAQTDSSLTKKPHAVANGTTINASSGVPIEKAETGKLPGPELTAVKTEQGSMQFSPPPCPDSMPAGRGKLIQAGLFHDAVAELDPSHYAVALNFLLSSGAAVPIPKGLVLGPLKERLNTPGFKNAGSNSAPPITRDVVAAAVLSWLWATNEASFQRAFEKNGRIDVDPDCKWLVQAAVDTAVGELSLEIAESMARGEGAFAEAAAARKANLTAGSNPQAAVSRKLDVCTASIVSKALTVQMSIDKNMSSVIPQYSQLVELLDETRLGALRAKSQERTLLATLVARNTTMTENFAHAYVSSMVRAGEALGHGQLFETAQDEEVMASTMIPYDIFTDDNEWEDPCKPEEGYTVGLSGDDLVRRSHARAMIQKSLRKLQDRFHVRGGTPIYGPFVDPENGDTVGPGFPQAAISPRPGPKRRLSTIAENPIQQGTGSGIAPNWAVYDPKHFCTPLEWDPDDFGNTPYGRHSKPNKVRSMSLTGGRATYGSKDAKRSMSMSLSQLDASPDKSDVSTLRGTREIDWADVASIFQSVELPKKSSRSKAPEPEQKPAAVSGPIFAPLCRELEGELSQDDSESETEEDLSEETTLSKHQLVLDNMKAHLDAFLEARKKQQERRKNRYSK